MLEARFLSELRAACPGVEPVVHIVQVRRTRAWARGWR